MAKILFSLIIPVYNEEDNILPLVRELEDMEKKLEDAIEIIFIDDGSADRTAAVLKETVASRPNWRLIVFKKNYGQTPALSAGIQASAGEAVILMDGDRQNDPADIPSLVRKYKEGYDLVSGWRKKRKDSYLTRILPSRIANSLISFITGVRLHDYGCTLKIYRASLMKELRIVGEMHRFLPAYIVWKGGTYTEAAVNHRPRISGRSKYNLTRTFKVLLDLITAKFIFSYLAKPIYFFGGIGLIINGISFLLMLLVLVRKIFLGGIWLSPLFFLSVFGILLGIQFILIGVVAEIIIRIYFATHKEDIFQISERVN
ncbi:MAG TPA: glycosyltransferase family 2 protein [bacterium]|nr:glycosyltransferase family 2 protein [bacterium]